MPNTRETKSYAGNKCASTVMLKEFVPPSSWSQDSDSHYLVLHLPGFKKEEVRLQVNDDMGEIITSGERQTDGNKLVTRFRKTFEIPGNSISKKMTGKFQGEILYITVPKRRSIVKNLKENQGIVITAVLAFSLGALACHKLSK